MQETRVGIVQLLEHEGRREIRFGRPYFTLVAIGLLGITLLLLQGIILVNLKRSGIAAASILLVPVALIFQHLRAVWAHEERVELSEGLIVFHPQAGVRNEIGIGTIQGITANENVPPFFDLDCIPKRPAVVIVSEAATTTLKGPRKFTDAEARFLLQILNGHRHGC